jgi:hypothetical protein
MVSGTRMSVHSLQRPRTSGVFFFWAFAQCLYYLSSIHHPELIQRFDAFLRASGSLPDVCRTGDRRCTACGE